MSKTIAHRLASHPKARFWLRQLFFVCLSVFLLIGILLLVKQPLDKDEDFHVERISELANDIKRFTFPQFTQFTGFRGIASMTYYPWLTLIPFALLKLCGLGTIPLVKTMSVVIPYVSFNISRYASYKYWHNGHKAMWFTVIYGTTLPFIYSLSLGQYPMIIGMSIAPLAFFGWLSIVHGRLHGWFPLSIGLTLMAYTHIMSTFLLCVTLAFLTLLISRKLDKSQFWNMTKAVGAALITSAPVWLPIMILKCTNDIYMMPPFNMKAGAYLLRLPLKYIILGAYNVISPLGALIIITGLIAWKRLGHIMRAMMIASLLMIWFNTPFLPWSAIQRSPLNILQFPSRTGNIMALLLAYMGTVMITAVVKKSWYKYMANSLIILICIMGVTMTSSFMYRHIPDSQYNESRAFNGDYMPLSASKYLLRHERLRHLTRRDLHKANIYKNIAYNTTSMNYATQAWRLNEADGAGKAAHMSYLKFTRHTPQIYRPIKQGVRIIVPRHEQATVPIAIYHAQNYELYDNGHPITYNTHYGMPNVYLNKGTHDITYHAPMMWYRYLAIIISILGFITFVKGPSPHKHDAR